MVREAVLRRQFRRALATSFEVAAWTAVCSTAIGTAAAFVFTRRKSRLTAVGQVLSGLPVMLPGVFIGIGFVALMVLSGLGPGKPMIVAGHTVVATPWVVLVMTARLLTYDPDLEAAARDLGASPMQVLRRVSLPILAPALIGSALLAFAWSFDETLVTTFTAGSETTVPLYIIGRLRRVVDPSGNAVAVLLLTIPWITFIVAAMMLRARDRLRVASMSVDRPILQATGIEIEHVTRRYGSVIAVDDVSLSLRSGAFFSLVGPSGCGKTTLLRILAGLTPPDAGRIVAGGRDITRLPPEHRPCNMVFQRYALFPHLTVGENLAFGLTTDRRTRPPGPEIRAPRARDARSRQAAGVGAPLSRGPLGRAAATRGGGAGADPAAAGAAAGRADVGTRSQRASQGPRGTAADPRRARDDLRPGHPRSGRSAVDLDGGGADECRPAGADRHPGDLYHRPATLFAAHFIGAGAFVDGTARTGASGCLDVSVGGIRFAAATVGAVPEGPVRVLLRPADLRLTEPAAGRVDGRVESCAFFGAYHELRVATRIGALRLVQPTPMAVGTLVGVTWSDAAGIAYAADLLQSKD